MSDDNNDLVLDQDWVFSTYEMLGTLEVPLDSDPLVFGPKRLNAKVAEARSMLSRCESVFLQASHDLHRFSRALRKAQTKLKMSRDYLFANDPETRAGRSVSDRDAIAALKLKSLVEEVDRLDLAVEDLKSLLVVIKAKRADLKDIQGRLRDQMKLCQEEMGLGSRWGSRKPGADSLDLEEAPVVNMDELDGLLQSVEGETHLAPLPDGSEDADPVSGDDDDSEDADPVSGDDDDSEDADPVLGGDDDLDSIFDEEGTTQSGLGIGLSPTSSMDEVESFLETGGECCLDVKSSVGGNNDADDDLDGILSVFQ